MFWFRKKDEEIKRLKNEISILEERLKEERDNVRNLYGKNKSMCLEIEILKKENKKEKEKKSVKTIFH